MDPDTRNEIGARDRVERAIVDACYLVGVADPSVRSVAVVGDRRLTSAELLRVREAATAYDLNLTMDGTGTVTIRHPNPVASPTGARAPVLGAHWEKRLSDLAISLTLRVAAVLGRHGAGATATPHGRTPNA
jgi:hypothetical protein